MTTIVEVDDSLLREAMAVTGASEKREAIEFALNAVIRDRRIERLIRRLGSTELALTPEALERLRLDE